MVRNLDPALIQRFVDRGAAAANSAKEVAELSEIIITCLPSSASCSVAMEADDVVITGFSAGKVWLEISNTNQAEIKRIGALVSAKGELALDSTVTGGCHRADTGNISVFTGGQQ